MIRIPVRIGKEDLFITSDSMQFMLTKELINKKGEVTQSHMAHYPTLEGMLNYLLQRKLRCCDAETLAELQGALADAKRELTNIWDTSTT